jgi:hypothetical protein
MILRTIRSTITFAFPFRLKGMERAQAAGTYKVDTDEQAADRHGDIFVRVATFLHTRQGASIRIRKVDAEELDAALDRDRSGPGTIR